MDHNTLHALEAWDYFSMARNFDARVWEACGGAPIVAAMIAAERLGANEAVALDYANSGDISGDRSRVVGYSADFSSNPLIRLPSRRGSRLPMPNNPSCLRWREDSVESVVGHKELCTSPHPLPARR